jgi:hypothetical protein
MEEELLKMKYTKIFADEEGETHFKDVEIELEPVFTPFSESFITRSSYNPATRYTFCVFPSGWYGDWHPTPRKQIMFLLSGEIEMQVSDGEFRRFHAGSIILGEDTTGEGHVGRVVGSTDVVAVMIHLPD